MDDYRSPRESRMAIKQRAFPPPGRRLGAVVVGPNRFIWLETEGLIINYRDVTAYYEMAVDFYIVGRASTSREFWGFIENPEFETQQDIPEMR